MDSTSVQPSKPPRTSDFDSGHENQGSNAVWNDWRLSFVTAAGIGLGFALLSAWLTPRGPVTTAEALVSMGAALGVGIIAGLMTGHKSAVLVVMPVVFIVALEFARIGMAGPTVDGINLTSSLGIVAFILGRVFHGTLVVLPMVIGGIYGVWLAGRMSSEATDAFGRAAWVVTGIATIALVALGLFIARPASTAAIVGADGAPVEASIAELITVEIGEHDQSMMIRGRSVDHPVLLYLAGGPGGTDIGAMRRDVGLEQDFVVVTWDQRGAGKSYSALDPIETFTLDQLVADTIEVTSYLRDRFEKDKIYLVGQSWGSTLGVLAANKRPDLYHAFVGVGQMVSQRETDILFWEDTLAWAETSGNDGLAEVLREQGPPPYSDVYNYDPIVSNEHSWNSYPGLDLSHEMPGSLFVPEYTFMDRVNAFKGFLDTNGVLYPMIQDVDFRQDVPRLDVPYYMVLGEHEARGRAVLADEWYQVLDAPIKARFTFEGSGHRPNFDRPGDFVNVMRTVLSETANG